MTEKNFNFIVVKKDGKIEMVNAKLDVDVEYSIVEYAEHLIKAGFSKVFNTETLGRDFACVQDITYGTDDRWKFNKNVYDAGYNSTITKIVGKPVHGDCVILRVNKKHEFDETNDMFISATDKDLKIICSKAGR